MFYENTSEWRAWVVSRIHGNDNLGRFRYCDQWDVMACDQYSWYLYGNDGYYADNNTNTTVCPPTPEPTPEPTDPTMEPTLLPTIEPTGLSYLCVFEGTFT